LNGACGEFVGFLTAVPAYPQKWWLFAYLIEVYIRKIISVPDLPVEFSHSLVMTMRCIYSNYVGISLNKKKFQLNY
jgi:hypothetical protein